MKRRRRFRSGTWQQRELEPLKRSHHAKKPAPPRKQQAYIPELAELTHEEELAEARRLRLEIAGKAKEAHV